MDLHHIKVIQPKVFLVLGLLIVLVLFSLLIYVRFEAAKELNDKMGILADDISHIKTSYNDLNQNLDEQLFIDHLKFNENIKLKGELEAIKIELETLKDTSSGATLSRVNIAYTSYQAFQTKLTRNSDVKLDVKAVQAATAGWGDLLIQKKFDDLDKAVKDQTAKLDADYKKYLATLPAPTAVSGGGLSVTTVDTERGKFKVYVIKVSKSSAKVKTIAAIDDDCEKDCPTKSLADYAKENNAFAGIAGSYTCPADYAQCADKKWSFDFALYDSNDGSWINSDAKSWSDTGMMTFNGSSSKFYEKTSEYGGGGVSAAIANFPSLLSGGNVVVDSGDVDSFQSSKGTRGVIATDDNNVYLAYVTGASVIDAAYAMKALGAKNALNLDGGGSAAMYINGKYAMGPGRPLPNVVLLVK